MYSVEQEKNPARGPYRKKLDRSRARDQPIKFEDLGIQPAQMLEKKIIGPLQFTITWYENRHAGEQTAHWDIQNKAT